MSSKDHHLKQVHQEEYGNSFHDRRVRHCILELSILFTKLHHALVSCFQFFKPHLFLDIFEIISTFSLY